MIKSNKAQKRHLYIGYYDKEIDNARQHIEDVNLFMFYKEYLYLFITACINGDTIDESKEYIESLIEEYEYHIKSSKYEELFYYKRSHATCVGMQAIDDLFRIITFCE